MSVALYLELLSDRDLSLLARAGDVGAAALRRNPELIESLLARRSVFEALYGERGEQLAQLSPFLAFALVVNRAFDDFTDLRFVNEWVAPRQRVPVFDVGALRDFAGPSARRLFLVELLASYTHLSSGRLWTRTARGFHRHRYSELDPVQLAELLEVVAPSERGSIYRRLGDLALFLSGVFPDHAGRTGLEARQLRRLVRALDAAGAHRGALADASPMERLEWLGRRSYHLASEWGPDGRGAPSEPLEDIASRFPQARRVLNFVADRYLFPIRERWFGAA